MNYSAKKVLVVNLSDASSEVRSFPDLKEYLGGVALGLKLFEIYQKNDPVIFSIGPLNGFFPFVSKTSIILENDGAVEDIYLGGSLSFRLAFSGLDSIVIIGRSKTPVLLNILDDKVSFIYENVAQTTSLGLPGKRSVIKVAEKVDLLDNFFSTPENLLGNKFSRKNVESLVLTGSLTFDITKLEEYSSLYSEILGRAQSLTVSMGSNPSCSGCPLGCERSQIGEIGGSVLAHCLVSCEYAKEIYSDVSIVFSCLNVLGYDYKHEDLEKIPGTVTSLLESL